jgi:hypothetical protein
MAHATCQSGNELGQKPAAAGDSTSVSDVTDSLERALDRIDAFRAIHEPGGVSAEAVDCLLEAVGIDEAGRVLVHDRIFESDEIRDGASAFLGVIIGLLTADLAGA